MRFDAVTGDAKQLLERLLPASTPAEIVAIWEEARQRADAIRDFSVDNPDCADELADALAKFRTAERFASQKLELVLQAKRLRKYRTGPTPVERALMNHTPRARVRNSALPVRRRGSSRGHRPVVRRARRTARSPGRQADDPSHADVSHAPAARGAW